MLISPLFTSKLLFIGVICLSGLSSGKVSLNSSINPIECDADKASSAISSTVKSLLEFSICIKVVFCEELESTFDDELLLEFDDELLFELDELVVEDASSSVFSFVSFVVFSFEELFTTTGLDVRLALAEFIFI